MGFNKLSDHAHLMHDEPVTLIACDMYRLCDLHVGVPQGITESMEHEMEWNRMKWNGIKRNDGN